jgi:16S rRNA (guanine1207-N2)-methyltransferase
MGDDAATWRASTLQCAGRTVTVFGRAGLPSGLLPTAAAELLALESVTLAPDRLLLCDVSMALPALLLPPHTHTTVVMRHAGLRQAAERTLAHAGINAQFSADGLVPAGEYDVALIEVAPTREAWRMRLYEAARHLRPGGVLIAAGPNDAGGKSAARDVKALFGSVNERSKAHQRVVVAIKPQAMPDLGDITPSSFVSGPRSYYTYPGVFAADRLDVGSAELIAALPDVRGMRVLDIGGGAGVLTGVVCDAGAAAVDVIDVDALAVNAMQRTFVDDTQVRVAWGDVLDGLPWDAQYDVVVTNPPFHAGKRTDDSMVQAFLAAAARHLRPRGELYLVANVFLVYEPLLQRYFGEVVQVRATKSFVVWRGRL